MAVRQHSVALWGGSNVQQCLTAQDDGKRHHWLLTEGNNGQKQTAKVGWKQKAKAGSSERQQWAAKSYVGQQQKAKVGIRA